MCDRYDLLQVIVNKEMAKLNLLKLFEELKPNTIVSIAGVGYRDGIPAKDADAGWTMGVVRRPDGDLIVADIRGHRIWRIDQHGILHTFAGDGVPGNSGDGGLAIDARVYTPHDLYLDKEGNLLFSELGARGPDEGPNTIRRIDDKTGVITRVVGSGVMGRGGDGGPALGAEFDTTCGVAVDDEGNIFVCGKWDSNVRRVDAKTGIIETFAGQNTRHYPSERGASRPYSGANYSFAGFHGDGGAASEAAFRFPEHLAFDSKGNLYVCDNGNNRIRKIDMQTGTITTVLGTGQAASNGDGGPAVEASTHTPDAIFIDVHDNLYVGEVGGCKVRKVDARTGIVTTLAGTGIPGWGEEGLPGPETKCNPIESGIWVDPDGTAFYSDSSGRLRRIDGQTGIVTTVLGGTRIHDGSPSTEAFLSCPRGICIGPDGHIYFADMQSDRIRAIDPATGIIRTVAGSGGRAYGGDNGPATEAYFLNPYDVSVDGCGRIIIADTLNGRVRRVDGDGVIHTVAGTGDGSDRGDGGPASGAGLTVVWSVAHGPDGSIYLGDAAGRIRRINNATGIISTVAGIGIPGYTGDDGPAVKARIGTPSAIHFDAKGVLYFSDLTQHVVRKVDTEGTITTVVGCGEAGFSPDGTSALDARLHKPLGLAVTGDGVVYVSDSRNNRVRRVSSDGTLQTVAGSDTPGDAGDGGPAPEASLNEPHGLCFYGSDILLISDHYNNRIKAVKLAK
ncbi:MAG: hypothetical protein O7E52_11185 [Candidatus Poribacteria bacterium]|nr:hypothetical protein [Candidatus Poribacteria bacterium]